MVKQGGGWACVVPGCKSRYPVRGHKFPMRDWVRQRWVQSINCPMLNTLEKKKLVSLHVCYLHFHQDSRDYSDAAVSKSRLHTNSVPSLNLEPTTENALVDADTETSTPVDCAPQHQLMETEQLSRKRARMVEIEDADSGYENEKIQRKEPHYAAAGSEYPSGMSADVFSGTVEEEKEVKLEDLLEESLSRCDKLEKKLKIAQQKIRRYNARLSEKESSFDRRLKKKWDLLSPLQQDIINMQLNNVGKEPKVNL